MLKKKKKSKSGYREWMVKKSNGLIPKAAVLLWSQNWTFSFFLSLVKLW